MHCRAHIIKKPLSVLLISVLGAMAGCAIVQRAPLSEPVRTNQEVFAWSLAERQAGAKLVIFPFSAPAGAETAAENATSAYYSMLLQKQVFREIVSLGQPVNTDAEALWYARTMGCDLAMRPSVLYLLDGTGAIPTRLEVRIRILDARSERVLWDLKQTAVSKPGADLDLVWTSVSGTPAQRYPVLAQTLADQFAVFLASPPGGGT
jgi:hypothetical protein